MLKILIQIQSLFWLLLFSLSGFSQDKEFQFVEPNYSVELIDIQDLNNKSDFKLNRSIVDKDGYIWITTNEGLFCFDGENYIVYKNGDPEFPLLHHPSNSDLGRIKRANDGNFYIDLLSENKIAFFDPYKRKVVKIYPKEGSFSYEIDYTIVDENGKLYISAIDSISGITTLFYTQDEELIPIYKFLDENGKPDRLIDFEFDGSSFIATSDKYIYVVSKTGELVKKLVNGNGKYGVWASYCDGKRTIFMSKNHSIIYEWDYNQKALVELFTFPSNRIYKFRQFYIKDNKLVCFGDEDIFVIDIETKTYQNLAKEYRELRLRIFDNIPIGVPRDIDVLNDGSILLTVAQQVYRLKPKLQKNKTFEEIILGMEYKPEIRQMVEDTTNGNIYCSYYGGVLVKQKSSQYFVPLELNDVSKLNVKEAFSLGIYKNNLIWNSALINLETKETKLLSKKNNGHSAICLINDSLWIYNWNSKIFVNHNFTDNTNYYKLDSALFEKQTRFNCIVPTKDKKNFWVGTVFKGIILLSKEGKVLKQYDMNELQTTYDNGAFDIVIREDIIWYGSANGIGSLNTVTDEIKIYPTEYISKSGELLKRKVFFILPKNEEEFYLGTNSGLVLFNTTSTSFFELNSSNKLSIKEFNRKAKFKSSTGRYFVGTTAGLYSFLSEELKWNTPETGSKVRVTGIAIRDLKNNYRFKTDLVNEVEKISLSAEETSFTINLSAVKNEKKILYSHHLIGLNDNWSEFSSDNKIEYFGLPPGNYVLEIKALNSGTVKKIQIHKAQYWYKLWYVQLLFILCILGLVFWFIRFRYNQKLQKEKDLALLRNKISNDLHDDVGSILTAVAMQTEILGLTAKEETKLKLKDIGNMSREAMSNMRDTVWAIDSTKDKIENLLDKMKDFLSMVFKYNQNMKHEFTYNMEENSTKIPPDVRQNIYLIFKEAITNAIKHSNGDLISIDFKNNNEQLTLKITDNGSQINKISKSGLGLRSMKKRAENMNGKLKIEQNPEGFEILLIVSEI